MPVPKKVTDLRDQYALYLEIGLILSLAFVIVATQLDFSTGQPFEVRMESQATVELQEIQQTKQEAEPPPPPRPPVPLEVPNTRVIEEQYDFDASIDLSEEITPTDPPSQPDEPQEETTENPEQEIFVAVEQRPELVGGMKALQDSVEYPEVARQAGVEGRVIVQFIVDENGNVLNPKILQGSHTLLNEEAIRVIKAQTFIPGKQRNQPVKVRMALPVMFRLKK